MADFEPGFANESTSKRFPTAQEIATGFPCGPADRDLFNMLINQIQEELGEVITWGGITHTNDRNTLVREAIEANLTPYLERINNDTNGGVVNANGSRQFVFRMSDNTEWTLQLPAEGAQAPGASYLANPVTIIDIAQSKTGGNYDSGNVNLNLNTLPGVTVPSGATGCILQTATSISGDQLNVGQTVSGGFVWVQVGGTLSGSNVFDPTALLNMSSYVDTNMGGNDNDNTSYPLVRLSGSTLAYRARVRWDSFVGLDTAFISIRLVGFTL